MMVKRLESVLGITKYLANKNYHYLSTEFLNDDTGEWEKHIFPLDNPQEVKSLITEFSSIQKELEDLDLDD